MGKFGTLFGMSPVLGDPPPMPTPGEWLAMQAQAQQNAQWSPNNLGQANAQNTFVPKPDFHDRARELFMRRMNGVRDEFKLKTGDFLHCHLYGDWVFVFFLLEGKEGVVKEAVDIFPSDQMIAQFRVVIS